MLNQYLDLERDARPAFLDRVKSQWPRLARWFVPLAEESRTTTSLLSRRPAPIAGELIDEHLRRETPQLESGTRLGPWRIKQFVGAGGMGKVYRGERADGAFEKEVAIKLIGSLRPGMADQLRRESHLLARLDHPTVTRLIDAGLTESDEPYLVMEWVEGSDLEDWLEANDIGRNQRLEQFLEVARAVAHAHQRLIVHGDIKPGNIRVTSEGRIKLLDFGVARLLGDDAQAGKAAALTPAFAAPEQIDGAAPTPASDVWALGALLNWFLTGATPRQPDAISVAEAFPGQSARGRELTAIIEKACAPRPDDRYATVAGLFDDLERFRSHYPVRAHVSGGGYRARKLIRRNRLATTSLAGLALLLMVATTVTTILYLDAENERQRAEQSHQAALSITEVQQNLLADMHPQQIADGLLLGLGESIGDDPEDVERRVAFNQVIDQASPTDILREVLIDQVLEPTEAEMLVRLGDDPINLAALRHSLGKVYKRWGLYPAAINHFQAADRVRKKHLDPDQADYHRSGIGLMAAVTRTDDLDAAEELADQVTEETRTALGDDHPVTLEALHTQSGLFLITGNHEAGRSQLENVVESRRKVLGNTNPQTLESAHTLAAALGMEGRYEEARSLLEEVITGRTEVFGKDHEETLGTRQNLSTVLFHLGEIDQALALLEEISASHERRLGRRHPDTLQVQSNLASVHREVGNPEQAHAIESELIEQYARTLGPEHPETLRVHLNLGVSLRELGELDRAIEVFEEVVEARSRTFSLTSPDTLGAEIRLVHAWWKDGRTRKAADHITGLVESLEEHAGPAHPETVTATTVQVPVLLELDRIEEAEAAARHRIKALEELGWGPDHPSHAEISEWLEKILERR